MPNPTYQGTPTSATLSATTAWTISKPAGVENNDFLLVMMMGGSAETVSSAPAGWTLLLDQAFSTQSLRVYWKIAASEGASWTWTLSANSTGGMQCHVFRGGLLPDPIVTSDYATSVTSTLTAPSIAPATPQDMLVCVFAARLSGAGSATTPSGMIEQADTSYANLRLIAVDTEQLASSAATGARTSTITNFTTSGIGFSLLLRPPFPASNLFFGSNF